MKSSLEKLILTLILILGPGSSLRMTLSGAERSGLLVLDLRAVWGEARAAARRVTLPSDDMCSEG